LFDLVDRYPDNVALHRNLAQSYGRLSDVMIAKGELKRAAEYHDNGLRVLERLTFAHPDDEAVQKDLAVAYGKVGDMELASGNIDSAQEAYRKKAEILKRAPKPLVQPDIIVDEAGRHATVIDLAEGRTVTPVSKEADLFASKLEIGNVLMARADTAGALQAYQTSVPIMERMAKADPGNVGWQLNLSIAYNSIGDAFAAQEKVDEALTWYRQGLAIRERLTGTDPSNANWQYALAVSSGRVGDILKTQGKLLEAFAAYQKGLAIERRLLQIDPNNARWQAALDGDANDIAGVSYKLVLAGEFAKALEASDQAIAAMPDTIWPHSNRAHALMFLGREDEARALYLKYRATQKAQGDRTWNDIVRVDFAELRKAGHTHPLMAEIETALRQATAAEPSHPGTAAQE
jgi:tetratricopeptide (TPR) repeat protein